MPEDYGRTEPVINEPDNLMAGNHPPVELSVTVQSGAGVLKRGQILGKLTSGGEYKVYTEGASDGSGVARSVLTRDIDATDAAVKCRAYFHGEFNEKALIGLTPAAKDQLIEFGIYVKEVK